MLVKKWQRNWSHPCKVRHFASTDYCMVFRQPSNPETQEAGNAFTWILTFWHIMITSPGISSIMFHFTSCLPFIQGYSPPIFITKFPFFIVVSLKKFFWQLSMIKTRLKQWFRLSILRGFRLCHFLSAFKYRVMLQVLYQFCSYIIHI